MRTVNGIFFVVLVAEWWCCLNGAEAALANVTTNDCVCATIATDAKSTPGDSSSVTTTVSKDDCGKLNGGILTTDGHRWIELNFMGQLVWVIEDNLVKSSTTAPPPCSLGPVKYGDCVCAIHLSSAHNAPGATTPVVATMKQDQCGKINGGILTKDGYKWYELKFQNAIIWVAGNHLNLADINACAVTGLGTVQGGDCVCTTTTTDARSGPSLSSSAVKSLTSGACGTINGGILTQDGYKWYELKVNNQLMWVAGEFLTPSPTPASCMAGGQCSAEQRTIACELMTKAESGILDLAKSHPSGNHDNAYAYNNVRDMCNGLKASRSSYYCSICPSGIPGGTVCLTTSLLKYLQTLANRGRVIVNELAGACHSCNSRHYSGQAVDLHNDHRTNEYMNTCVNMRGWALDEGDHIHCQFT